MKEKNTHFFFLFRWLVQFNQKFLNVACYLSLKLIFRTNVGNSFCNLLNPRAISNHFQNPRGSGPTFKSDIEDFFEIRSINRIFNRRVFSRFQNA